MALIVDSQLSTQKEVWGETNVSLNPEINCLGGQLLLCCDNWMSKGSADSPQFVRVSFWILDDSKLSMVKTLSFSFCTREGN